MSLPIVFMATEYALEIAVASRNRNLSIVLENNFNWQKYMIEFDLNYIL